MREKHFQDEKMVLSDFAQHLENKGPRKDGIGKGDIVHG
jgi:hypothetical protein